MDEFNKNHKKSINVLLSNTMPLNNCLCICTKQCLSIALYSALLSIRLSNCLFKLCFDPMPPRSGNDMTKQRKDSSVTGYRNSEQKYYND